MHIEEFEYHSPASLTDACQALHSGGPGAKIIAGGTDILVDLKKGLLKAASLISLLRLNDLKKIEKRDKGLWIGPLVTSNMLASSCAVRENFPGLSDAAASMAANQIRNLATIGGNLCSAVPSADIPPALLSMEAELLFVSLAGERKIAVKNFFLGPRETAIRQGEILIGIFLPELPQDTGTAYEKFQSRDASALAIAGAAAMLTVKEDRIVNALVAIGACAPAPLIIEAAGEFLKGKKPLEQNFATAGALAAKAVEPITDIRASENYRRELCRVLTFRALKRALTRISQLRNTEVSNPKPEFGY